MPYQGSKQSTLSKKGTLWKKYLIKEKVPYPKNTLPKKGTLSKKYLTKKPYQESKKGALSWSLAKSLEKVPYQES